MKTGLRFFLLLFLMFLGGCCKSGTFSEKTLRLAMEASPKTLDPAHSTDTFSGIVLGYVYSNLVRFDHKGALVLDVAKHYSVDKTATRYTFLLKEDLKFSNGDVLTAQDVSFSLHRLASPSVKSERASLLENVAGYEEYHSGRAPEMSGIITEGDFRITIVLKAPFSPFVSFFAMPQFSIVNRKFVENGGDLRENMLGSGPWKLDGYNRDKEILFSRNPFHPLSGNVKNLLVKIIKEPVAMVSELMNGRLDIVELPPQSGIDTKSGSFVTVDVEQYNLYFLGMNMSGWLGKNHKLRKAICYGIDRETILAKVNQGRGKLATGPVPPGLLGYLQNDSFSFDLKKAKELVLESGYQGETIRLMMKNDPVNVLICEAISSDLEKIGLKISLTPRDWNAFSQSLFEMNYDLFYRNWVADYPDGDNFLYPLYHSSSRGMMGNYPGYVNLEFDRLMGKSRLLTDPVMREAVLVQAALLAREDASRALLWYKKKTMAVSSRIQNYQAHPMFNSQKFINVNILNH